MILITLEQAKNYCKVDLADDDDFIYQLIEVSLIYIDSMVSEAYKVDEKGIKLADLLQLFLVSYLYDKRTIIVDDSIKDNRIVSSILDKLANYQ